MNNKCSQNQPKDATSCLRSPPGRWCSARRLVVIHALFPNRMGNSSGHCVGQRGRTRWLLHCVLCCLDIIISSVILTLEVVSVTGKLVSLSGQGYCQSPKQVYSVAPWYPIIKGAEIANCGIFRDSFVYIPYRPLSPLWIPATTVNGLQQAPLDETCQVGMRRQNKTESLGKSPMSAWGTHISGDASLLYQPSPSNKSRCKHQEIWMETRSCWPSKWSYSQKITIGFPFC